MPDVRTRPQPEHFMDRLCHAMRQKGSPVVVGLDPRVERTAFLIGESAIFALQVERIIRSSNNPNRRAFREAAELLHWLEEVLTLGEQVQLEHFVRDAEARAG